MNQSSQTGRMDFARGIPLLGRPDCGIAPIADNVENVLMFRRNGIADEKRPGDIVINRVRLPALGPHIHEQKVAFPHRKVVFQVRRGLASFLFAFPA